MPIFNVFFTVSKMFSFSLFCSIGRVKHLATIKGNCNSKRGSRNTDIEKWKIYDETLQRTSFYCSCSVSKHDLAFQTRHRGKHDYIGH